MHLSILLLDNINTVHDICSLLSMMLKFMVHSCFILRSHWFVPMLILLLDIVACCRTSHWFWNICLNCINTPDNIPTLDAMCWYVPDSPGFNLEYSQNYINCGRISDVLWSIKRWFALYADLGPVTLVFSWETQLHQL